MKYCPNPVCPYQLRRGGAAEFLDRATVCSDCGIELVDKDALTTEETAQAVAAWHGAREEAAESPAAKDGAAQRRLDITTGVVLIGLSVVLLVGSYMVATSMGGGRFFIAFGPFVYGVVRLGRGLDGKSSSNAD